MAAKLRLKPPRTPSLRLRFAAALFRLPRSAGRRHLPRPGTKTCFIRDALGLGRCLANRNTCALVSDPTRSPGFVGGNRRFVSQDVFELVNAFEQAVFGELIDRKDDGRLIGQGQRLTGKVDSDNRAWSVRSAAWTSGGTTIGKSPFLSAFGQRYPQTIGSRRHEIQTASMPKRHALASCHTRSCCRRPARARPARRDDSGQSPAWRGPPGRSASRRRADRQALPA